MGVEMGMPCGGFLRSPAWMARVAMPGVFCLLVIFALYR
jgi:hypothetical protein